MSSLRRDTLIRLSECENPPSCSHFPTADIPILGECENHPPCSHFPANDIPICVFAEMMYKVACASGYKGTEAEFTENFVNAISSAAHMKHIVVDVLPEASVAYADTIYMIKDTSITLGDAYKEYMLIDGAMVQSGDTSVNLEPYATKAMLTAHEEDAVAHITAEERIAWNAKVDSADETYTSLDSNAEKLDQLPAIKSIGKGLILQEDGTLIGAQEYTLPVASPTVLGGVKVDEKTTTATTEGVLSVKVVAGNGLSATENGIAMALASADSAGAVKSSADNDKVKVETAGTMSLNRVSATKLYVPEGDELIFNGGNA